MAGRTEVKIRDISKLHRWRLALLNGVSATGGYLLFPGAADVRQLLAVCGGTALLAAAGSAFNQVLERDVDLLMSRTKGRPLPAGTMTVTTAVTFGVVTLLFGLFWIVRAGGVSAGLFGVFTLVWYLAVYTPLKRRTSLSLLLGALCGAMAPVIGWTVAGGAYNDHHIQLVAGVMFLWQIPHFWLLQNRYCDDYRAAGFPTCTIASGDGRTQLMALWMVALTAGAMLLPLFGVIQPFFTLWYALFIILLFMSFIFRSEKALFACLNMFPLLLTLAFAC